MFSTRQIFRGLIPSLCLAGWVAIYAADAPAKFKVGEFNFSRPEKWEWVAVTSAMRKAQLKVADEKTKGAAEVVFFSGNMGGVQANVQRWFSQFQEPREKINPKTEEVTVGKHKVTYASAQGTYVGMPGGPQPPQKDHALLGAIITSPQGDVYVRMTGPSDLVKRSTADFKKLVEEALK
ncbi:MAG: hypothetical protein HY735_20700 [Verrucomicrobia bacterium]|nr:hypothetical protein [Verrucomicrobiota bacterium]